MYLSPAEIASGRQHSLNNFQTATVACVSASERLTQLFTRMSRQQLEMLKNQPQPLAPSGLWLSDVQSQSATLLGELLEIIGDVQQTVIITAAAQTRAIDQLLVTSVERARSCSPAEILPALDTLRQSLEQTERGVTGWAEASRQALAQLAQQFAQRRSQGRSQADTPAGAERVAAKTAAQKKEAQLLQ